MELHDRQVFSKCYETPLWTKDAAYARDLELNGSAVQQYQLLRSRSVSGVMYSRLRPVARCTCSLVAKAPVAFAEIDGHFRVPVPATVFSGFKQPYHLKGVAPGVQWCRAFPCCPRISV